MALLFVFDLCIIEDRPIDRVRLVYRPDNEDEPYVHRVRSEDKALAFICIEPSFPKPRLPPAVPSYIADEPAVGEIEKFSFASTLSIRLAPQATLPLPYEQNFRPRARVIARVTGPTMDQIKIYNGLVHAKIISQNLPHDVCIEVAIIYPVQNTTTEGCVIVNNSLTETFEGVVADVFGDEESSPNEKIGV